MVRGYHGSQEAQDVFSISMGIAHFWRVAPTLHSEQSPWRASLPSKMGTNDPRPPDVHAFV